jgi:hypothetical protein
LNHAHDVFFAHDEDFVAVYFDALACVFTKQYAVADFDVERLLYALIVALAWADGDDFALVWFFCGAFRDDDARGSCALCVYKLSTN